MKCQTIYNVPLFDTTFNVVIIRHLRCNNSCRRFIHLAYVCVNADCAKIFNSVSWANLDTIEDPYDIAVPPATDTAVEAKRSTHILRALDQ